jgi:hypothetical protein
MEHIKPVMCDKATQTEGVKEAQSYVPRVLLRRRNNEWEILLSEPILGSHEVDLSQLTELNSIKVEKI